MDSSNSVDNFALMAQYAPPKLPQKSGLLSLLKFPFEVFTTWRQRKNQRCKMLSISALNDEIQSLNANETTVVKRENLQERIMDIQKALKILEAKNYDINPLKNDLDKTVKALVQHKWAAFQDEYKKKADKKIAELKQMTEVIPWEDVAARGFTPQLEKVRKIYGSLLALKSEGDRLSDFEEVGPNHEQVQNSLNEALEITREKIERLKIAINVEKRVKAVTPWEDVAARGFTPQLEKARKIYDSLLALKSEGDRLSDFEELGPNHEQVQNSLNEALDIWRKKIKQLEIAIKVDDEDIVNLQRDPACKVDLALKRVNKIYGELLGGHKTRKLPHDHNEKGPKGSLTEPDCVIKSVGRIQKEISSILEGKLAEHKDSLKIAELSVTLEEMRDSPVDTPEELGKYAAFIKDAISYLSRLSEQAEGRNTLLQYAMDFEKEIRGKLESHAFIPFLLKIAAERKTALKSLPEGVKLRTTSLEEMLPTAIQKPKSRQELALRALDQLIKSLVVSAASNSKAQALLGHIQASYSRKHNHLENIYAQKNTLIAFLRSNPEDLELEKRVIQALSTILPLFPFESSDLDVSKLEEVIKELIENK